MRRLFWRIFAAFWLANVAIIVSVAWITTLNFESEKIPGLGLTRMQAAMDDQLQRIGNDLLQSEIDSSGKTELESRLRRVNSYGPITYFAVDSHGVDLIGQTVPDEIASLLSADRSDAVWPERIRHRELTTADGVNWTLVAYADGSIVHRVLYRRSSAFWSQFVIALVISAVVSALLAWYVAVPLGRIRVSTRRFAEGDLDVRVGRLRFGRSAEMTALASEFDRMAERIKRLILNNRRLVRDISHELRSPLARLRVAVELARDGDADLTRRSLDRIEREADRLESMLSQAIELSRLETGIPNRREPLALDELLDDVIANADYEGAPRGRKVVFAERVPLQMVGSHDALSSALENIVRNALAYTADGSVVEVRLKADDHGALIVVRDHGPGVAEAELHRLIEPFYRTDAARSRSSGGTGLGLAIANSAIEQQGGSLTMRNADGGGMQVSIRLPLQPAH